MVPAGACVHVCVCVCMCTHGHVFLALVSGEALKTPLVCTHMSPTPFGSCSSKPPPGVRILSVSDSTRVRFACS